MNPNDHDTYKVIQRRYECQHCDQASNYMPPEMAERWLLDHFRTWHPEGVAQLLEELGFADVGSAQHFAVEMERLLALPMRPAMRQTVSSRRRSKKG